MQSGTDLETSLLGPLVAGRECGDCTACCTWLTVDSPDFKKPAGVPCVHLGNQGCSIHAVRPHICRTWFCVWRRLADLPEVARPDQSGLLVSLNFEREPRNCLEGVSINVRALVPAGQVDRALAGAVLDRLCEQLIPVWFSDGSTKELVHPAPDVARLVLSGEVPPAHLHDEVAAWRERYSVFAADARDES